MFFAFQQEPTQRVVLRTRQSKRNLIRLILAAMVTVSSCWSARGQTTYYVSSVGSDSNTGQSINSPLQSLTKVSSLVLKAGDSVLFRRGDIFQGTLKLKQSGSTGKPIVLDAYGSGAKPKLAGSVMVSDWTTTGGNVWQATCPTCGSRVTGLYRNNTSLPLGRYPNPDAPNKGFLTVQAHSGKTQLTSQQPLTTNWTGGEVVARPVQWILDRALITKQTGNTLTLTNNSNYDLTDGWGYFIQNHPATLDQNGEWYYDPKTKLIQLYDDSGNPNGSTVTATTFDEGINLTNASNITIRNLHISQTRTVSVYALNASNLTLSNNDVTNAGEDAVTIDGSGTNLILENNFIDRANNNGVVIRQYQNVTVRGNTIRRIGLVAGRSKSGDGQAFGFQASGNGPTLIENNVLDSLGYNGIVFWNNATIQRNVVSNFCLTKSDGGGLYVWNGNKQAMSNIRILSNIVYNGTGAAEGAPNGAYSGANGIYLDDCTQNAELSGNTVFDCAGLGIFLHATNAVTVRSNTSYNNQESQFMIAHNNGVCPARGNLVQNNVFVSQQATQLVAKYESKDADLAQYGSFSNNLYARPFDDLFKIRAVQNEGGSIVGADLTLSRWQTKFQQDLTSANSPMTYKGYSVKKVSDSYRLNTTFVNTNEGWSTWGPYNNGKAAWDDPNKLDGGCLRIDFPISSGKPDAYMIVTNGVGAVEKDKSYLLRFDAVASDDNKLVQVFLRQQDGPYSDISSRTRLVVSKTRKAYEIALTATAGEARAITVFQVSEDGQTVWLDNIRLQEATVAPTAPGDSLRLVYNPTTTDSTVWLDGIYRDRANTPLRRTVTLSPFSSVVLFKDPTAPVPPAPASVPQPFADLDLSLETNKRCFNAGDLISFTLRIRNGSLNAAPSGKAQWSCRLPANVVPTSRRGLLYSDGILSGTVQNLPPGADTTFQFDVKAMQNGLYRTAAQLTIATFPDPDSTPGSGTADGEDDMAAIEVRVGDISSDVFVSPNPEQRPLAPARPAETIAPPKAADLSLRMAMSSRAAVVDDIVSCTITVSNAGGLTVDTAQIQNQLPEGLAFIRGDGWSVNGRLLNRDISNLSARSSVSLSFDARVVNTGRLVNQAQISSCSVDDPDSTPNNGFSTGEDDEAQADIRIN